MTIGVNARILTTINLEGVHRYIYETTLHMTLAHPEDQFVLFFDRQVNVDFGWPSNVKSVVVPWHARHPIMWYWWFEVMLPIYFWWYRIDVFYSGDGYLSKRSKIPTVMAIHDLAYIHFPQHVDQASLKYYRKNVPTFLQRAEAIITVSHYVKMDLIRQFKLHASKISVAYNAVTATNDVRSYLLSDSLKKTIGSKPYFLYVGAIHPRKNIINLIEGFTIFNKKNGSRYQLILAGRMAWYTKEIEHKIQSTDNICYIGLVSDEDKFALIKDAIALTYVSIFEGFGIPLLEAMKMGTPVITSNTTSMPEVADGAALLVDPTDLTSISSAIQSLVDDPLFRQDLIHKGNKRYLEFSWIESAETIYQSLKGVKMSVE